MSAFDRVTAALKEPNKKRTPEEAAQLKADLAEMRDRAYLARRAGATVKLIPYLKSLMQLHDVEFQEEDDADAAE